MLGPHCYRSALGYVSPDSLPPPSRQPPAPSPSQVSTYISGWRKDRRGEGVLSQLRPMETSSPPQPLTFALASSLPADGGSCRESGSDVLRGRWEQRLSGLQIGLPQCQNRNSSPGSSGLHRAGLLFSVISAIPIPAPFPENHRGPAN